MTSVHPTITIIIPLEKAIAIRNHAMKAGDTSVAFIVNDALALITDGEPCAWHKGGCPEMRWTGGPYPVLCRHHNAVAGMAIGRAYKPAECKYGCGHKATTIDDAGDYVCRVGECGDGQEVSNVDR